MLHSPNTLDEGGAGTKVSRVLAALRDGPKTNRELCEIVDDIGPYVARMCAKLRQRGLVINTAPAGRGHTAVYALSGQSRAA